MEYEHTRRRSASGRPAGPACGRFPTALGQSSQRRIADRSIARPGALSDASRCPGRFGIEVASLDGEGNRESQTTPGYSRRRHDEEKKP